jgi:hypothetical protein
MAVELCTVSCISNSHAKGLPHPASSRCMSTLVAGLLFDILCLLSNAAGGGVVFADKVTTVSPRLTSVYILTRLHTMLTSACLPVACCKWRCGVC